MLNFNAVVPELAVTDWRRSLAFYCDLLGFEVVYSRPEEGFAFLRHGEAQLMIDQIGIGRTFGDVAGLVAGALGRGINLQIRLVGLDPLLDGLRRAGLSLEIDSEERIYRIAGQDMVQRQFVVADPDGYLLRFCEMVRVVPATPS
jgi:catechol 2,3-dioxygenase-like lactoylglutathione lyase family enzyme